MLEPTSNYPNSVKGANSRLDHFCENIKTRFIKQDNETAEVKQQIQQMDQRLNYQMSQIMEALNIKLTTPDPQTPKDQPVDKGNHKHESPQGHEPLPFATTPAAYQNKSRLPDGNINLQKFDVNDYATTEQERRIIKIWPEAVLSGDAVGMGRCDEKNKVIIPPTSRLIWADNTILDKLSDIQHRFKIALIPYDLWATRLATELAGDFQQVAIYTRNNRPTWVTLLEVIFQVLDEHHVLNGPITVFATLLSCQDESMVNFLRRLREAYYRLPHQERSGYQNREILINVLRAQTPSVWLSLHDHIGSWNTAQMMEEAVRRAGMIARTAIEDKIYSTPSTTVQLHGTTAPFYNMQISQATPAKPGIAQIEPQDATDTIPAAALQSMISDPRKDDRQVSSTSEEQGYAAKVADNECFNCGKKGHWAKDCNKKPQFPRKTPQGSEKVTIKGTMFKDDHRAKFANKLRSTFNKWNNNNSKRVHFADNNDNEDDRSPAEILADPEMDQELADLIDEFDKE
ncbi:hypothetical protein F4804DRAFT_140997 [Jackrogersella minutella]|nr:hypothetical protein F4804DRAFT_140997 [Jackrogersella minutella]